MTNHIWRSVRLKSVSICQRRTLYNASRLKGQPTYLRYKKIPNIPNGNQSPLSSEVAWKAMSHDHQGAVLPADKQMPITIRIVNASNLPAIDNLEWYMWDIPYFIYDFVLHIFFSK